MRAIGISLGLAFFVSISACKDDSAGVRSSQNPPQTAPGSGSNMGFVTEPPQNNPPAESKDEESSTTDTAPDGS